MKEFLSQQKVEFTERDIARDPAALGELEQLGYMTTPVTLVDGAAVVGFDRRRLEELAGLNQALPETLSRPTPAAGALNMAPLASKEYAETLEYLAARWGGARPLLPAFRLLARGEPVQISSLADAAGTTTAALEKALAAARCERDEAGRLVALFGMTLRQTRHRIEIGGQVVYSCCGLWAQIIPKLVESPVVLHSQDPVNNQVVRLVISPERVESVDPPGTVATMAVASATDIAADIGPAFCSHVCYFSSRENAARFAQGSRRRHVVEVRELEECARELKRMIWAGLDG